MTTGNCSGGHIHKLPFATLDRDDVVTHPNQSICQMTMTKVRKLFGQ